MVQNDIVSRQNERTFLNRLAAQRHLYSKTKTLSAWIFVLCIIVPVLLAIAKVVWPIRTVLPKIIVVYSVAATLMRKLLKNWAMHQKVLAARIQQLFDCELFGLPWNKALCGAKPQPEEIHKQLKGANLANLENWYSEKVAELPKSVGSIVCMRTNVVYDHSLRSAYSKLCVGLTALALLAVFVMGAMNNTGIWDAFLFGIVPLMPLISWGIDMYQEHSANQRALCNLETLIDSGLEEANVKHQVSEGTLNEIQNFMFLHRKTSYLIPDYFYKLLRGKQEEAAYYGVEEICSMYHLN